MGRKNRRRKLPVDSCVVSTAAKPHSWNDKPPVLNNAKRVALSQLPNGFPLSSTSQRSKTRSLDVNDRLSDLPNDIVLFILSSMTMKEVARMSVLSHHWNYIWRCFPNLNFEDKIAMDKILVREAPLSEERSKFLEWVNHVVDQNLGPVVNELSFAFDLDSSYQCVVDKWVAFAVQKQVKTFVLNLRPVAWVRKVGNCTLPRTLFDIKPSLTSLCLKYVNADAEEIECILESFPLLENLTIEESTHLTSLRVSGSSLNLKYLEVSRCKKLKSLEVYAPKLLSFVHYGQPLKLCVQNARLLSMVSIGWIVLPDPIAYAFDSFSEYFSQLEYLCLEMCLDLKLNHRIDKKIPTLRKLNHLEMCLSGYGCDSILGWVPLIEACPVLEKLSLKMCYSDYGRSHPIVEHRGQPLKCLKTLELVGFRAYKMDLEFAVYVFKNAPVLEEVTVDFRMLRSLVVEKKDFKRIVRLKERLPRGVKLTTL